MPVKLIANALLFQAGWFACVLGGTSAWLLVPLAALFVHFTWISSWAAEGKLVVSVMLAGAALDSFLLQMGVFSFAGDPVLAPLWLVLMWALLGTTLNHCLAWSAKPVWMACLLGAIAGPFSYFAGATLADVGLPLGAQASVIILALCWAAFYPLVHGFAHLYRERFRLRQQITRQR